MVETNTKVTSEDILNHLKLHGYYRRATREITERKATVQAAREMGIEISDEALQQAADAFRLTHGLSKARNTTDWLKSMGIDIDILEEYLETNLIIEAFKQALEGKTNKNGYIEIPEVKKIITDAIYNDWLLKQVE